MVAYVDALVWAHVGETNIVYGPGVRFTIEYVPSLSVADVPKPEPPVSSTASIQIPATPAFVTASVTVPEMDPVTPACAMIGEEPSRGPDSGTLAPAGRLAASARRSALTLTGTM